MHRASTQKTMWNILSPRKEETSDRARSGSKSGSGSRVFGSIRNSFRGRQSAGTTSPQASPFSSLNTDEAVAAAAAAAAGTSPASTTSLSSGLANSGKRSSESQSLRISLNLDTDTTTPTSTTGAAEERLLSPHHQEQQQQQQPQVTPRGSGARKFSQFMRSLSTKELLTGGGDGSATGDGGQQTGAGDTYSANELRALTSGQLIMLVQERTRDGNRLKSTISELETENQALRRRVRDLEKMVASGSTDPTAVAAVLAASSASAAGGPAGGGGTSGTGSTGHGIRGTAPGTPPGSPMRARSSSAAAARRLARADSPDLSPVDAPAAAAGAAAPGGDGAAAAGSKRRPVSSKLTELVVKGGLPSTSVDQKQQKRVSAKAAAVEAAGSGLLAQFLAHVSTSRRSEHQVAGAVCPPRDACRLFDAFVVVGADTEYTKASMAAAAAADHENENKAGSTGGVVDCKPEMLYCFPSDLPVQDQQLIDQCAKFCFPSGVQCRRTQPQDTVIMQIMFGQLSELEVVGPSYVFMFTGGEHLRFGICVQKPEFVALEPVMALDSGTATKPSTAAGSTTTSLVAPRCYCFLSRFPFLHLHFEVLYSLLAHERLWAQQTFGGDDDGGGGDQSDGHGDAAGQQQQQQTWTAVTQNTKKKMETILTAYYNHAVPGDGLSAVLKIPGTLHPMEFFCPPGAEDFLIAKWVLPTAIAALGLDGLLAVVAACLCEYSILFQSRSLGTLSAVALSVLPLLRPWVWQGTFIPLLPRELHECLNSPVPFIIGVHGSVDDDVDLEPNTVTFDLNSADSGELLVQYGSSAPVLRLPHDQVLRKNLEPHVREICTKLSGGRPCGKTLNQQLESSVKSILNELSVYHHWLLASLKRTTDVTATASLQSASPDGGGGGDSDAALDQRKLENVLISCQPAHKAFVRRLLESQLYQFYVNHVRSDNRVSLIDSKLEELANILRVSASQSPVPMHRALAVTTTGNGKGDGGSGSGNVGSRTRRRRGLTMDSAEYSSHRPVTRPSTDEVKQTIERLDLERKNLVQIEQSAKQKELIL